MIIRDHEQVKLPMVRSRYGLLEGYASVFINFLLALAKLAMGIALQSAGLISDAVHSLSDMATSVVVIISFQISRKPADAEHPFGHAKAEYVAALIVAILLVVGGFELGKDSTARLLSGDFESGLPPLTVWILVALLAMIAVKEALALFSGALARIIDSPTLAADAWHHRTDAISTGLVLVGLGGRNFGLPWLDSLAGALVAVFIAGAGVKLAWGSISPLLGESVNPVDLERMRELAQGTEEVRNVHDLSVHRYGHFYFTTVHVELSDALDVHTMHEVTVLLETRILKAFPGECVVHVDPLNLAHPLYHRVSETLKDAVIAHPDLVEFRDLNLWSDSGQEYGKVELSPDPLLPEDKYAGIAGEMKALINRSFPNLEFDVRIKVDFSASALTADSRL